MDSKLKCKLCGTFLTGVLAVNLVASNVLVCEPCRKKNEENPDFHEIIRLVTPAETVMINISGTASTMTMSADNNGIHIIIPKNYL